MDKNNTIVRLKNMKFSAKNERRTKMPPPGCPTEASTGALQRTGYYLIFLQRLKREIVQRFAVAFVQPEQAGVEDIHHDQDGELR